MSNLQSWLNTLGPYAGLFIGVINLMILRRAAANIKTVEIATNSMKDALVSATAKASDLEGEKRGIAIGLEASKST